MRKSRWVGGVVTRGTFFSQFIEEEKQNNCLFVICVCFRRRPELSHGGEHTSAQGGCVHADGYPHANARCRASVSYPACIPPAFVSFLDFAPAPSGVCKGQMAFHANVVVELRSVANKMRRCTVVRAPPTCWRKKKDMA